MNLAAWTSRAINQRLAAAATAAVVASAFGGSVVFAEEKRPAKPHIYDEPQPEIILVEHPTRAEHAVAVTKKVLKDTHAEGKKHIQTLTDQWIKFEQSVERTVKETIAPGEQALPGVIYVGVAGLAGNIVARNRGIFLRLTSPLIFATAASYYFLPGTTRNVGTQLYRLEQQFPAAVSAHQSISDAARQARAQIDETVGQLRGAVPTDEEARGALDGAKKKAGGAVGKVQEVYEEKVKPAVQEVYEEKVKPAVQEVYEEKIKPTVEGVYEEN
ncbi:apolipo protein O-domain-containing protein, partial [Endogone sp. FLAS-F59071]